MWFPEQFFISHLAAAAKLIDNKKLQQTLASNRHGFLQARTQSCQNDLKQNHFQVSRKYKKPPYFMYLIYIISRLVKLNGWVVKMENVFRGQPGANLTLEHIERAINLLLHGLGMACELQTTLMAILNLHGKLSVPLTKYIHSVQFT